MHDELIAGFAGMEAALGRLRAAQRRLAIVTSKSADTTAMAFRAVGLRELLRRRGHGQRHHRAQAVGRRRSCSRWSVSAPAAERAVYVGDAPVDVAAGKAAGVATVAVTWGVFAPAALAAAEPDFTVATPAALADLCLERRGAGGARRRSPRGERRESRRAGSGGAQ